MTSHRSSTLFRLMALGAGYWRDGNGTRPSLLMAGMITLGILQVVLAVRLNLWSADLFDSLEQRSTEGFLLQVAIFAGLVAGVMVVNLLHIRVKRSLQIGWREWLTEHILDLWMADARHYRISLLAGDHDNPDGRIADDIRVVTESAIELIHSALYCLMLFASFCTILWTLSGVVHLEISGTSIPLYGHMVWLALLYAAAGSILAFVVGGKLVNVANQRQTAEADFRFGLADAREHAEAIALARWEDRERPRLRALLQPIRKLWDAQTTGLGHLMLFSSAYGVLATMFPILVSSPRYLAGAISLGVLMQIGQAFQQMTAALSWPIDNFPRLAEWHASADRILGLHDALTARAAGDGVEAAAIALSHSAGPALAIRDLSIAHPAGGTVISGVSADIQPGERVLITGDADAGQLLLKAICGIWIWGSGRIELPAQGRMALLSGKPYFPAGTLRDILAHAAAERAVDDAACATVLDKTGLGHLKDRLLAAEAWMQVLSPEEQQRLAFANLLLMQPEWVLLSFAAEALAEPDREALFATAFAALPQTTFVVLCNHPVDEARYTRKLVLQKSAANEFSLREQQLRAARAARPAPDMSGLRRLLHYIKEGMS